MEIVSRITFLQIKLGSWNLICTFSRDVGCVFYGFQLYILIAPSSQSWKCSFWMVFLSFEFISRIRLCKLWKVGEKLVEKKKEKNYINYINLRTWILVKLPKTQFFRYFAHLVYFNFVNLVTKNRAFYIIENMYFTLKKNFKKLVKVVDFSWQIFHFPPPLRKWALLRSWNWARKLKFDMQIQ